MCITTLPPPPDFNGHDYVDLGLPSGTLWATCNVGASKPSDYGQYFQWGDTSGYTADQVGKDKQFKWSDCKWRLSGDSYNNIAFSKYTTLGETLELADDAANANMGGDWHMPTPEQIQELIDNTTTAWTTSDDVRGIMVTSNSDPSKSIFIPVAGGAWGGSVHECGFSGYVWSSMLGTYYVSNGQSLNFDSDDAYLSNNIRNDGCSVRGVLG